MAKKKKKKKEISDELDALKLTMEQKRTFDEEKTSEDGKGMTENVAIKEKKSVQITIEIPGACSDDDGRGSARGTNEGEGEARGEDELGKMMISGTGADNNVILKPPSPARSMSVKDVERIDLMLSPTKIECEILMEDVDLPYDEADSVAFFDLDHTVVDTNSSWLWVQHEINCGRVGAHMIMTALYWFGRYALGYGAGAERAGADAAETYKGIPADKLRSDVENFFDEEMKHRARPGFLPVMQSHKRRNQRVIMCTSTWQHPAETAAKMFGFEYTSEDVICSQMQVNEEGVLDGKLAKIAYGDEKYERTKEWAEKNNVDLKKCYFYTDSYSDVKLMEHVGYPVAVNPDPRLMQHAESRGWEIVDWGIAPVRTKKPRYHYGCLNGQRNSVV